MELQELWYQAAKNSGSKQRRQRSEERERERQGGDVYERVREVGI